MDHDNDGHVEADEAVIVQELQLKALAKRKDLLIKQREGMENNLSIHRMELPWLKAKESSLSEARLKHYQLYSDIQSQLKKSEERLKQFPAHILELVGDSWRNDVAATDPTGDNSAHNDLTKETTEIIDLNVSAIASPNDSDPSDHSKPTWDLSTPIENPFTNQKAILSLLHNQQYNVFFVLHPMLHGKRLQGFIDLSIQDFASMDEESPKGTHRRESLFRTCLIPFPVQLEHHDTVDVDQEEDLDADRPLCPYEMSGECNDPFCRFQHFKKQKIVKFQRQIKEMIPLPSIRLSTPLGASITRMESDCCDRNQPMPKKQKVDSSADATKMEEESLLSLSSKDHTEANQASQHHFLDFGAEFVSLPKVNSGDRIERSDCPPDSSENWWMDNDDRIQMEELWNAGNLVTLKTYIRALYRLSEENGLLTFEAPFESLDDERVLQLLGRFIDALQFFLHSGRYDLLKSSSRILDDLLVKYIHVYPCHQLKQFIVPWSQSWSVTNHKQSLFAAAIEQQTLLFSINHFLWIQYGRKATTSNTLPCDHLEPVESWDFVLAWIVDTNKRITQSATSEDFLEQCRIKCSPTNMETRGAPMCDNDTKSCMLELAQFLVMLGEAPGQSLSLDDLDSQLNAIRNAVEDKSRGEHLRLSKVAEITKLAKNVEYVFLHTKSRSKVLSKLEYKLEFLSPWRRMEIGLPNRKLCFILAPILALRVSFLVSARRYHKARNSLEEYVDRNMSLCSFSDLLWSQVVMLRSILPTRIEGALSAPNATLSKTLSSAISNLGIRLNYLSLAGDRALLHPFGSDGVVKERRTQLKATVSMFLHRIQLDEKVGQGPPLIDMLDLESIPMGFSADVAEDDDHLPLIKFPRSLLLGGCCLRRLKLSHCRIQFLPHYFGDHFPNLQELMLDNNLLQTLPPSLGNLSSLLTLDVSHNQLRGLPQSLEKCLMLESLLVRNNALVALPDEIYECTKLRQIDLRNNCVQSIPAGLVLQVESLVQLDLEGNPCLSHEPS